MVPLSSFWRCMQLRGRWGVRASDSHIAVLERIRSYPTVDLEESGAQLVREERGE